MAAKLTKQTHKIAIQLHLVAEICTICSSHSKRPVPELLDTPSYICDTRSDITELVHKCQFLLYETALRFITFCH
jgi:hypothetical protein